MLYDHDSQKQKGYAFLLRNNNFANDLDATITNTKIEADQLYSRYV